MVWKWDRRWELTTQAGKRTQLPLLLANPEDMCDRNLTAFGRNSFPRPEWSRLTHSAQHSPDRSVLFLNETSLPLPHFLQARGRKSPTYFKMHLICSDFYITQGLVDSSQQRKRLWHWQNQLFDAHHMAGNEQNAVADPVLWAHWCVRKFISYCRYSHRFSTDTWISSLFKF